MDGAECFKHKGMVLGGMKLLDPKINSLLIKDIFKMEVLVKPKKYIISYYAEDGGLKKKFVYVKREVYEEFASNRSRMLCTNYKILKQMNLI